MLIVDCLCRFIFFVHFLVYLKIYIYYSSEEPLQRVVRISRNGEIMATGGTDGHIRVWQFPAMNRIHNIKAHSKEIDDLDICPDSASVSIVLLESML